MTVLDTYAGARRADLERFLAAGERLLVDRPAEPTATVVVVTWNRAELVLESLRSVAAHGDGLVELVVVDNASTDETRAVLDLVDGATVLRNPSNDGFLLAANQGVAEARGWLTMLLNSDAVLAPGCVRALVRAFEGRRDVGAVGGRLLTVDGRLQEAGSMLLPDGSVVAIGAGDDPDAPPYAFERDVDYCSGALLAVDTALWRRLGGFDERYAPAYYEDVDLCVRVRAAGRRVLYTPGAVATHVGFGSGRDLGEATRLAERNRERLVDAHPGLFAHAGRARAQAPAAPVPRAVGDRAAVVVGVPAAYRNHLLANTGHGRVWSEVLRGLAERLELRHLDPSGAGAAPDVWLADGYQGPLDVPGPCVVELHEAAWDDPATVQTVDREFAARLDGQARAAATRATRVITLSESSRRQIVRRYGVPADRVHAIHPGVDTDVFRPGLEGGAGVVRGAGGSGAPYVVCVATAHPRKNLGALRDAMAALAGRGFPHQLALVVSEVRDDPRSAEYLRDAIAPVDGHRDLVVRVACATDDELARVLAGAAAFCLPSLMEGFGLPALEAMACGVPVVVSNAGSLPEVVGDSGRVVEPTAAAVEKALAEILGEPDVARALGAAARRRAEQFTWSRTVAGWEEVLRLAAADRKVAQGMDASTEEAKSIYHREVDPDEPNNAHSYLVSLVGWNKRVLEVGCASGYVTEALVARGCSVVGLEVDAEAAEQARKHADRVIVGDVESLDDDELAGEQFDVVTFGDVLEHLHDPLATLRRFAGLLAPDGFVVASVPNVAHADVRLRLWRGDFPYAPIGLLDETHVRFFTWTTLKELFAQAGLLVTETKRVIVPVFGTELAPKRDDVPQTVLTEMLRDAEAETYQFVVKAVPDGGDAATRQAIERLVELEDRARNEEARAALLRAEKEEAENRAREVQHLMHAQESELQRVRKHVAHTEAEMARVRAELAKAADYARRLEEEIAAQQRHVQELDQRLERADKDAEAKVRRALNERSLKHRVARVVRGVR